MNKQREQRHEQQRWRRVEVCDLALCSVRESQKEGLRYCFRVLTPSQPPLVLQAQGPLELHRWLQGIHQAMQHRFQPNEDGDIRSSRCGSSGSLRTADSESDCEELVRIAEHANTRTKDEENQSTEVESSLVSTTDCEETFRSDGYLSGSQHSAIQKILDATIVCAECGVETTDELQFLTGDWMCRECQNIQSENLQTYLAGVDHQILFAPVIPGSVSKTNEDSTSSLDTDFLFEDGGKGYQVDHTVEMIV